MIFNIQVMNEIRIKRLYQLKSEADAEGYKFVRRAIGQFLDGQNDFTGEGEIFFGAYSEMECIGICGLNIDPYTEEKGFGRVRHLYVTEKFRGKGVAAALVNKVIANAEKHFNILRLKSTPGAVKFYDNIGFERHTGKHESHRMILRKRTE